MLIYLAGPYRAKTFWRVLLNILRAWIAARKLWLKGFFVFCPHLNSAFMGGKDTIEKLFQSGDLQILSFCDALLRLPGNSQGADIEVEQAREWCIPVYFSVARLIADHRVAIEDKRLQDTQIISEGNL